MDRNQRCLVFDPFCLDLTSEYLWNGAHATKLRPKVFAVLEHLVRRAGRLVTKEELLNAIWPGTFVGDAVLKVIVREIRDALGDDPKSPRFIETAHRRGYRFIGQITNRDSALSPTRIVDSSAMVVGRDSPLSRMQGWLEKMLAGERQIVFVTGEAGIGKTALVDAFAHNFVSDRTIRIGRGQCLEQYGTSEAYLPVLEAIGRLCREDAQVTQVLRAHAPMWLLQLPSLLTATDRELLSREVAGATRERMLREMGEALEVLTADVPLVLILEDLHWSDYSTLDLISYLARQRHSARLMLIGTYRVVELLLSGHPLQAVKGELLAKQQCEELSLDYLSELAVREYLKVRFPSSQFPPELAALIHDRTEGNPLFMVNAVDCLVADRLIVEGEHGSELTVEIERVELGVPDGIRQMIEKQIERLGADEQRTLEAASVAGAEFSTVAVAAGLGEDRAVLEGRCHELARRHQFIQDRGVQLLPNGEAINRYGFIHALYQNVLYDRMSALNRVRIHTRIGQHAEELYADRATEMAAELAMHFERAANHTKAVKYLEQAAENAVHRFAYREAVALLRRALDVLENLPDAPDRARQELGLQTTLGVPLIATEGYAAPDVGRTYARARELCHQLGDTPELPQVLWGLWTFYVVKAELTTAREIAEEFSNLMQTLTYARLTMGITLMHLGEFARAMGYLEEAIALYDSQYNRQNPFRYSQNPSVSGQCYIAWTLCFIGQPDAGLRVIHKGLALARELGEPHGLAHSLFYTAIVYQLRQEPGLAREYAEAAIAVSTEHGLVLYAATATIVRGWALNQEEAAEDGIEEMRRGLAAYRSTGTELLRTYFLGLLAEALGKAHQTDQAMCVLEEAMSVAYRTNERYYLAELYRLKGELLVSQSATQAERCFNQSIKIAQQQRARYLEHRSLKSLNDFVSSC